MKKIGIYNPYLQTKGGGERMSLALAETLAADDTSEVFLVTHSNTDLDMLAKYFDLDLHKLKLKIIRTDNLFLKLVARLHLPSMARNFFFDTTTLRALKKEKFDVFVNSCYHSNMPSPSPNGVYLCMFPQTLENNDVTIGFVKRMYLDTMRVVNRVFMHPRHKYPTDTYKLVISISEFTKSYVKKLWHRSGPILYPVCEDMKQKNQLSKQKIILHVGRFFENAGNNHHKRQDMLIESFANLKDLHKDGWELHFVGSVAEDVGALKYILELMKNAQGLPIHFHFNSSFGELKDLYNKATIYWHATGFGSDIDESPERQEHFGISTVEAMSTGTIPIVINTAGQKEIITNGGDGYLWDTQDELITQTRLVAGMENAERKKISNNAEDSAKRFNATSFRRRVLEIFSNLDN